MVSDLCWVGKITPCLDPSRAAQVTLTLGKGSGDAGRSWGPRWWSLGVPARVTPLVLGTPKLLTAPTRVRCWLAWVCDPTREETRMGMGATLGEAEGTSRCLTHAGGCRTQAEGSCQILLPSP